MSKPSELFHTRYLAGQVALQFMSAQKDVTPDGKITKTLLKPGKGRKPNQGEKVCLIYEGRLKANGEVFDSSAKNGHKFKFELGKDEVIDGLTLSVGSMNLGERSVFVIHPDSGSGATGREPTIPPSAFLEFDIELADIREKFFNALDADRRATQIKDEAAGYFKLFAGQRNADAQF
jgi:FKBP-type peptidyl-prolyl cis-trans isomerase